MQKQPHHNQLYIGPSTQSIQPSDIIASYDTLLLLLSGSKRSIYVMNYASQTMKHCIIDDQRVICATYHPILDVFFINTDKRLVFINKQAQTISKQRITEFIQAKQLLLLPMSDGYKGIPNQRMDSMIFITNQYTYVTQIQIEYERGLLKNKNLCNISIKLITKEIILYQWITKCNYLADSNMMVSWNQSQVYVFKLTRNLSQKPEMISVYDKVSRKSENKCNCFQICQKHRFLLAGFQLGSIKVYKYDETKKYVCELRGHQRQCASLYIPKSNHDLLYSSGLDNTIRIWDLIDLLQVYYIRLDTVSSRFDILNENMIFGKSLDNRKSYICSLNIDLLWPMLSEQKSGNLLDLKSDGQWIIALYSNNLIECSLIPNNVGSSKEFNEKIQFPVKYGFLRESHKISTENYGICLERGFSVIRLNRMDVMSEQFQLKKLVYNHSLIDPVDDEQTHHSQFVEVIHEKLLNTFLFSNLSDWKSIPVSLHVTAVYLLFDVSLPKWDVDVKGVSNKIPSDYVVLGSDRGYVFFVDITKRKQYYSRVHYHSDSVTKIQRITHRQSEQDQLYFMSISMTNEMVIWSLSQQEGPQLKLRITYPKSFTIVKFIEHFLIVCMPNGSFNILQMWKQKQTGNIRFLEHPKQSEYGHYKPIIACDHLNIHKQHLFLTGGEDRYIKIWRGSAKELLGSIIIFNQIHSLIFNHRGIDILVAHGFNSQFSFLTTKQIELLREIQTTVKQHESLQELEQAQYVLINLKNLFTIPSAPIDNQSKQLESSVLIPYEVQRSPSPSPNRKRRPEAKNKIELPSLSNSQSMKKSSLFKKRQLQSRSFVREFSMNDSFLPEIGNTKVNYNVEKQSRLARMQLSRQKAFSLAGRRRYL